MNDRLLTEEDIDKLKSTKDSELDDSNESTCGTCIRLICKAQDAKTAKMLIAEIESKLQKFDDYRLVITKANWQSFKQSKGG